MQAKSPSVLACALFAALVSGSAVAAGYQGNWPVTITGAHYYDGSYCLMLSGSLSGGATLIGPLGNLNGNFEVHGRDLIAIVPLENGACGCNSGEVLILPARNGTLAKGTYVEDGDGEIDNSGSAKVGSKNGC